MNIQNVGIRFLVASLVAGSAALAPAQSLASDGPNQEGRNAIRKDASSMRASTHRGAACPPHRPVSGSRSGG